MSAPIWEGLDLDALHRDDLLGTRPSWREGAALLALAREQQRLLVTASNLMATVWDACGRADGVAWEECDCEQCGLFRRIQALLGGSSDE